MLTTPQLLSAVKKLIIPFIKAADDAVPDRATGNVPSTTSGARTNVLVDAHKPEALVKKLRLEFPVKAAGKDGLLELMERILELSVNTWDQGFMDKLYASPTAVSEEFRGTNQH